MIGENSFAEILKAQGEYVIEVDGIDWYEYQGFMMPAYLPHSTPPISKKTAEEVLRISGRPFVRWNIGFGIKEETPWWYILRRGPWSVESVSNKKKRWMVRQGKKNFEIRVIPPHDVLEKCPAVAMSATQRYRGCPDVENIEILSKRVKASKEVPGVLEYIGCFSGDVLVSYSENYVQDNAVWLAVIRHHPDFLGKYSSYALMDGILEYYLNDKKMDYVLDGSRNIHHRTEFQNHLESVYGFTKEYSRINVVYSKIFYGLLKATYSFKDCFFKIQEKRTNRFMDNVCAVMRQESIRRACRCPEGPQ